MEAKDECPSRKLASSDGRAVTKQMGGVAMADSMRRNGTGQARAPAGGGHVSGEQLLPKRVTPRGHEQSCRSREGTTSTQIVDERLAGLSSKGNKAIFFPLTHPNENDILGEIHVFDSEPAKLGSPKPCTVEKLQHGTIP